MLFIEFLVQTKFLTVGCTEYIKRENALRLLTLSAFLDFNKDSVHCMSSGDAQTGAIVALHSCPPHTTWVPFILKSPLLSKNETHNRYCNTWRCFVLLWLHSLRCCATFFQVIFHFNTQAVCGISKLKLTGVQGKRRHQDVRQGI